ncbi:MAG: putative O-glycosylation ligase, exosortase A system-associated [Sphingomonadaceae bacterium]|nr:putative O-glycosylation ligase, exosortase A system-associated [Sphingomonadaceae bacterium]
MRDLAILGLLLGLLAISFRRPWMLTFAYLYVDLTQPQRLGYSWIASTPISFIFAVLALGGFFVERRKNLRLGFVQAATLSMIAWFTLSYFWSAIPDDEWWFKWDSAWKSMVFAVFLPFVITTRRRLDAVVSLIVLAIGLVSGNAALKTLGGGGGYDNLAMIVPTNKGIYESSTASTLAVAIIPLAFYLARHSPLVPKSRLWRAAPWAVGAAGVLTTVGTEARTGLICLAAMAAMTVWTVKRKLLVAAGLAVAVVVATPFMPKSFLARMGTIATYQQDVSAAGRTEVWKWTWNYVLDHPLGGGFKVFRLNKIEIDIPNYAPNTTTVIGYTRVKQEARAFHSSYFEVLGELGFVGLALWLSILGAVQIGLMRLRSRFKGCSPEDAWIPALSRALAQAIVVYLVGALFVGIAFQTALYTLVGVSIALIHYVAERRAAELRSRRFEAFQARVSAGNVRAGAPIPA